jgi:sugar O-acyltransferase (sialic acid O-acetyltransferase NeuD family)
VNGIVIVGAGGFGREVLTLVRDVNEATPGTWDFLGFLSAEPPDATVLQRVDARYLGADTDLELLASLRGCHFVAAIGACSTRRAVTTRMTDAGLAPATLVHPTAVIGEDVELGAGAAVCAGSILTTNIRVGRGVSIDRSVNVGHDCVLGEFATLAPGSTISGNVTLADEVYMGTNSCTIQGVAIGAGSTVGAGAVVTRDVEPGATVVGAPARPLQVRA